MSQKRDERMILYKAIFRPTIKSCKNAILYNSNPSIIWFWYLFFNIDHVSHVIERLKMAAEYRKKRGMSI